MNLGIDGQVALVTGAAHGIGKAIALGLAGEGCKVAVLDREGASARTAVLQIHERGGRAYAVAADVTDAASVASAVRNVIQELGGLHIVVNCAGFSMDAAVARMTDDQWRQVVDVTLTGAFHIIRAAAPHLTA